MREVPQETRAQTILDPVCHGSCNLTCSVVSVYPALRALGKEIILSVLVKKQNIVSGIGLPRKLHHLQHGLPTLGRPLAVTSNYIFPGAVNSKDRTQKISVLIFHSKTGLRKNICILLTADLPPRHSG